MATVSGGIVQLMTEVMLPPDLEHFAAEAVAQGRYTDVGEVVRAGLALLKRAEAERAAFNASLHEAEAEGERDGFLDAGDVHREMAEMLEEMVRARV